MRLSRSPSIHRSPAGPGCTAVLLLCLAQGGCVYRMPIQQGNFLEPRVVDKLEIGMTRAQVRYLLGTPMVPDTFDADRWDYLYYLKKGRVHAPVHTQADGVLRRRQGGARRERRRATPPRITDPVAPDPPAPPRSGA